MQTSDGGRNTAVIHWFCPGYDPPCAATLPLLQGCAAAHSIASYPSRPSLRNGSHFPSYRTAHALVKMGVETSANADSLTR